MSCFDDFSVMKSPNSKVSISFERSRREDSENVIKFEIRTSRRSVERSWTFRQVWQFNISVNNWISETWYISFERAQRIDKENGNGKSWRMIGWEARGRAPLFFVQRDCIPLRSLLFVFKGILPLWDFFFGVLSHSQLTLWPHFQIFPISNFFSLESLQIWNIASLTSVMNKSRVNFEIRQNKFLISHMCLMLNKNSLANFGGDRP